MAHEEIILSKIAELSDKVDHKISELSDKVDHKISELSDKVDQRFDGVDRRFDGINQRFESVEDRLDLLAEHAINVDQRLSGLEEVPVKIDTIVNVLDLHTSLLNKLELERLSSISRFERLESHIGL